MDTDIIIYFIKTVALNFYIYYCFKRISNKKVQSSREIIFISILNFIIATLSTYAEIKIDGFLPALIICLIYGCIIGCITKNKIGYALITTIISFAISSMAMVLSAMLTFLPYKVMNIKCDYLNMFFILIIQLGIIYSLFSIKRFKNGFAFINKKINNDTVDVIVVFMSIVVILIYGFMGSFFQGDENMVKHIFILFILLSVITLVMIQRTLITHYKQTQLLKTLDEYKAEIDEQNKEIERLSNEKYNTSRIRHEFYNRQKALELMVKQFVGDSKIEFSESSENILKIIENLSNEYSNECDKVKQLPELKKTGIFEIDNMFIYMQNECVKNNIVFKLRILGEIYPLVNNIIGKDRLETLIGDHIRDSINAINNEGVENREILVLLGKKDKKYELSIHDTGIEFEIDTLLKLGAMRVTTCEAKGGTGIGFMTTFETLRQTGASLIITENEPSDKRYYTKSVTIRFDGKQQYKVISYRAAEIEKTNNRKDIIISKLNDKN